jgi:hypothetical protein
VQGAAGGIGDSKFKAGWSTSACGSLPIFSLKAIYIYLGIEAKAKFVQTHKELIEKELALAD